GRCRIARQRQPLGTTLCSDAARLLRQPHCFEGLGTVGVCVEARDQALAESGNPSCSSVNRGTAATSTASDASQGKNPTVAVPDLLDLPSQVLPAFVHGGAVLGASVATAEDR